MKSPQSIFVVLLSAGVLSVWLNSHNRLLLVVDRTTGSKGCVSELPQFLGIAPDGILAWLANCFCFLWVLAFPALAVWGIIMAYQRRRRRVNASGV